MKGKTTGFSLTMSATALKVHTFDITVTDQQKTLFFYKTQHFSPPHFHTFSFRSKYRGTYIIMYNRMKYRSELSRVIS